MRAIAAWLLAMVAVATDSAVVSDQLRAIAAGSRIAGAAAVTVRDGRVDTVWTWGVADRGSGRLVDAGTRFRFGSVSKHLTGLLAARLAAAGRIDLQARVTDLLPGLRIDNPWAAQHPLLLIHLLEHTGGLPGSDPAEYATDVDDLDPAVYACGRVWHLRWPPGRFYSYANAGHTIAAAVMQHVTGVRFDDLIRSEVSVPTGMRQLSMRTTMRDGASASYHADGTTPESWWSLPMRPSGAASGCVGDLAALVCLHATGRAVDGTQFLPPRYRDALFVGTTAVDVRAGFTTGSYGLGGFGFVLDNRMWYGHWGKIDSFLTAFGVLPETGDGFALVVNTADGGGRWRLMQALARHLVGDRPAPTVSAPAQTDLSPYAGWYQCDTHDMIQRDWIWRLLGIVHVENLGDHLHVQPAAQPWRHGHDLVAIDAAQFREQDSWLPRDAFVAVDGQRWYIGDQRDAYRPIHAASGVAWIVIAWLALLVACLQPVVVLVAALGPWRARAGLGAAVLIAGVGLGMIALVATYAALGIFGSSAELRLLGGVTCASIGLCAISLAIPVLLILALVVLIRGWHRVGRWRYLWLIAFCVLTTATFALADAGWIPLLTWR